MKWELKTDNGVRVLGYDGYEIAVDELMKAPGFFVEHVSRKVWAEETDGVVADLVDNIVTLTQGRVLSAVRGELRE